MLQQGQPTSMGSTPATEEGGARDLADPAHAKDNNNVRVQDPGEKAHPQSPPSSHPGLIRVDTDVSGKGTGIFSAKSLPAGSLFVSLDGATPAAAKSYATVQRSSGNSSSGGDAAGSSGNREAQHVSLNSDLVYTNHSCDPSLEFDMAEMVVRVSRERDLEAGDELTFFYPSSEWDLDRPFACRCGASGCLGQIDGAKQMDKRVLRRYWLNRHIEELLLSRDALDNYDER